MQTSKKSHVAALKGDTIKKHGAVTQTGTGTQAIRRRRIHVDHDMVAVETWVTWFTHYLQQVSSYAKFIKNQIKEFEAEPGVIQEERLERIDRLTRRLMTKATRLRKLGKARFLI